MILIRSHLVKSFPQDVCDLVIAEVHYFQRLMIIPNAEKIPIQTRQDVAIEKKDWKEKEAGNVNQLS